jgi:protocatechuate 3,4-dioxygenase beta subunit
VINVYDVDGDDSDSNEGSCDPLRGALVDIWHSDSQGIYSGIQQQDTTGQNYLRGNQVTDENGTVQFTTVYPGWSEGRAIHIHIKVRTFEGSNENLRILNGHHNFTLMIQLQSNSTHNLHTANMDNQT